LRTSQKSVSGHRRKPQDREVNVYSLTKTPDREDHLAEEGTLESLVPLTRYLQNFNELRFVAQIVE
jgi:hypothetical protein